MFIIGTPWFIIPNAPAICDINAIWFIIISCNTNGFVIPAAIAFISIGGIPFIGKAGFIITGISGGG